MFIHSNIRDFQGVRTKYHLDLNSISCDGMNIIEEYVGARTEESKSGNKYDKR